MSDLSSSALQTPPAWETSALDECIGPALIRALTARGFSSLTRVQQQVLDPALRDRDLRISSQTGSGKTVAIGLVLRDVVCAPARDSSSSQSVRGPRPKSAEPRAIVIVPTRELAAQVQLELSWLYAPLKLRVASVTGGSSYREEHRALARGPAVVVGTPGRLLDHLARGAVDAASVGAVVLDEADQMLDLGFREELEAILEHLPGSRRTHLVSATFAREVMALADRVQTQAARVEGTPLGSANTDIEHVIHLIDPSQRVDALINVLLHHPDDQTLIFARTRADVAEYARELQAAGFAAGALSGEMDQVARNRALAAFKRGQLRALVATDVAARGIDVQNIVRVVQIDAPPNADSYTHRSGRTGRAGRKGTSVLLISKGALQRTQRLLQQARVKASIQPVPTAETIRAAQDARMLGELTAPLTDELSERVLEQVARIVEGGQTRVALARLLMQLQQVQGEPRPITKVAVARERARWVSFRVNRGKVHGADARRLVAMLCRRGRIRGADIGAIKVCGTYSDVEVSQDVAATFAQATFRSDPRNPRVDVRLRESGAGASLPKSGPSPKAFRSKRPGKRQKRHAGDGAAAS